ncbi:MAG: glycosyltransferase [Muribaculaceae bacterium]|nr:glycosyltransferase [Muribaculaceae bacterium]
MGYKMGRILVYDVAAEYGGALKVLLHYYESAVGDKANEYYFVVSKPELEEQKNIRIIRLPWVKRSWFHRIFCDRYTVPRLIRDHKIDHVISLQNIGIKHCDAEQSVYVHNALPFSEYRFKLYKEPYLWIYQNIIGYILCDSLKKVDEVIVQNEWMRDAVADKAKISSGKIRVEGVTVAEPDEKERIHTEQVQFFYPADAFPFKNHTVIIDACKKMKSRGISDYTVIFTLDRHGTNYAEEIYRLIEENRLPIRLTGYLDREEMSDCYRSSTLLFPSYIETVGLPLLEARAYGAKIIAADCMYARCALKGYDKVRYFDFLDSQELMKEMIDEIQAYGA